MNGGFEHEQLWHPLARFGVTHRFFALNATTLINTWIAMGVLFVVIFIARYFLYHKHSKEDAHMHPPEFSMYTYGAYVVKTVIKSFISLVEQSSGTFMYRYFTFTASLFIFILFCNWVALIPFIEEPTKDLNTTLALGVIALLYIQKEVIKVHGFIHYLKNYFLPINTFFPLNIILGLVLFPLKVLGELASVISLSFRLFGNIFGGAIITQILQKAVTNSFWLNIAVTFTGINLLLACFFVLFEGGLQAFVFTILTLTNISMATAIEQGENA